MNKNYNIIAFPKSGSTAFTRLLSRKVGGKAVHEPEYLKYKLKNNSDMSVDSSDMSSSDMSIDGFVNVDKRNHREDGFFVVETDLTKFNKSLEENSYIIKNMPAKDAVDGYEIDENYLEAMQKIVSESQKALIFLTLNPAELLMQFIKHDDINSADFSFIEENYNKTKKYFDSMRVLYNRAQLSGKETLLITKDEIGAEPNKVAEQVSHKWQLESQSSDLALSPMTSKVGEFLRQKNPIYWLTYDDPYISQQRREADFFVPFQGYDEDKMINDCIDRVMDSEAFEDYYFDEKKVSKEKLRTMLKAFCTKDKDEIRPIDEEA